MKVILRGYGIRMTTEERQIARAQATDMTLTRGTDKLPGAPTSVTAQSGPRGIFVTWGLPGGINNDIQRWRVYKGDETSLYAEIADRGCRQCFIETSSGASPVPVNVFVSSVNPLGKESPKVLVQGQATAETGAPTMPLVPPGWNTGIGKDQTSGYGGGTIQQP